MTAHEIIRKSRALAGAAASYKYITGKYNVKETEHVLDKYSASECGRNRKRLAKDIIKCGIIYSVSAEEYLLFHFETKNAEERRLFVSGYERRKLTHALNKQHSAWQILKDKYQTYLKYKAYYNRDAVLIDREDSIADFLSFTSAHRRFILKPLDSTRGEGIRIIDLEKTACTAEQFFRDELSGGKFIAEELIKQAPELARFHPESINTVRLVTWIDDDKVTRVFSVFRMGFGDNYVDNAGAGGGIASVDTETGEVTSDLMMEDGVTVFEKHPDTGVQVKGSFIPQRDELKRISEETARIMPDQKWIGWDFALSDKGWVVVEANQSPSFVGIQMCTGKGIRPIITETLEKGVKQS